MTKYDIYDSYNYIVRGNFPSFKSAIKFKMANNRMDWKIVKREYKQSKTITFDDGLIKIIYNRTINVPVDGERVKRTETEFTIYLWESE